MAEDIQTYLRDQMPAWRDRYPGVIEMKVAVMGCIVNGPGEARRADYGIAGGAGEGVVFAQGRPVRKVPQDQLVDALFAEIARRSTGLVDC